MRSPNHRRYSFGGKLSGLLNVAVWKFDVALQNGSLATAYVKCANRDDAFRALFAACSGSKIHGTGLPLAQGIVDVEVGRSLEAGEVFVDNKTAYSPRP